MSTSDVTIIKPLNADAVCAAVAFAGTLPQFTAAEGALGRLAAMDEEWSLESLVIKVSALDSLYATNIYGAVRMAEWIHRNKRQPAEWTNDTVETIAALPNQGADKPVRRLLSFASKFAYFFVDPDRFPLYDQYAFRCLLHHVKTRELRWEVTPRYADYVHAVNTLRAACESLISLADLDCYLWLAGQWMVMQRATGASAMLNKEITGAFNKHSPEREAFAALLLGS